MNTGAAKGQKCVTVRIYINNGQVTSSLECANVDKGESSDTRVTYTYRNAPGGQTYECTAE